MPLKPDVLEQILKRLDDIDRRLAQLEYDVMPIKRFGSPTIKPLTPPVPEDIFKNCPKCGLKLETVMGYCCPNTGCPTGLGPVTC